MKNSIQYKILFLSIVVGCIVICGFAYITGSQYATALFPEMALLSGFILTGFIIGYWSEGVTIMEPGIGAVIVSFLSYFLIPLFNIETFKHIWFSDWLLMYGNGIVLTFIGAWLGEIIEHGSLSEHLEKGSINWAWIIAGTISGVTFSIFVVNLLTILLGPNPTQFIIPYFIALLISGLLIGWKSPGVTIKEAGISGFLTITVVLDIVRLTLITESEIGWEYIIFGGILGTGVSVLGAFIGEKIQARYEVQ